MEENLFTLIGLSVLVFGTNVAISIISWPLLRKTRSRSILFFMITWIFYAGSALFDIVTAFLSHAGGIIAATFFFKINYAILVPGAATSFFAFAEFMRRDTIGLKAIFVVGVVNGALFAWIVNPAFQLHAVAGFLQADGINQDVYWFLSSVGIWIGIISFFRWSVDSWRKAPPSLKKPARVLVMMAIVDMVALVIQISYHPLVVVLTSFVSFAFVLAIVLVIRKHPALVHLLPYKVYKLLLAAKNGVTCYEKSWCTEEIEPDRMSSLLTALSTFAEHDLHAVNPGQISAIKMQNTILLTVMDRPVLNVLLVASKASMELRAALDRFVRDLFTHLGSKIGGTGTQPPRFTTMEIQRLVGTPDVEALVVKHFSNIATHA